MTLVDVLYKKQREIENKTWTQKNDEHLQSSGKCTREKEREKTHKNYDDITNG